MPMMVCNNIKYMKRPPYTLRCAQGAALPVCLPGPVREPLTPSLYAKRWESQDLVKMGAEVGDFQGGKVLIDREGGKV